jgi:LmbE family N-acetylglucosaminyl deacetylase
MLPPLPEDWERALAIVAHPDDLEYCASSAVARWTAHGKSVAYVIATRGEAGIDSMDPAEAGRVRTQEQIASARAVGVDLVEFLDHPDGEVEYGRRLRADLVHAIRRHRPEVLVSLNPHLNTAGGGPNMADHRAVGTAVLDAARDAGNRWLFRRSSPDDLEPWDGVRMVCFAASPSPTHSVDVVEFVDAGIAALKAQHTYIAGLGGGFDPEHYLRDEMSRAGGRAGLLLAVEFEVWPL